MGIETKTYISNDCDIMLFVTRYMGIETHCTHFDTLLVLYLLLAIWVLKLRIFHYYVLLLKNLLLAIWVLKRPCGLSNLY